MKLIGLPGNEVPEGLNAGELTTSDGMRLRYALLDPPADCRGTVCILPGRADFIERFFETIEDLRRRRFAVAILDWRGQGGSQRPFKNPCQLIFRQLDGITFHAAGILGFPDSRRYIIFPHAIF